MSWQGAARHTARMNQLVEENYAKKAKKRGDAVGMGASLMSLIGKTANQKLAKQEELDELSSFAESYTEDGMSLKLNDEKSQINITKDGKHYGSMKTSAFRASLPYLQSGTLNLSDSGFIKKHVVEENPYEKPKVPFTDGEENRAAFFREDDIIEYDQGVIDSNLDPIPSFYSKESEKKAQESIGELIGHKGRSVGSGITIELDEVHQALQASNNALYGRAGDLFDKLNAGTITKREQSDLDRIKKQNPDLLNKLNEVSKGDSNIPDTEKRDVGFLEDVDVNIFEADLIDKGREDVVLPFVKPDGRGGFSASTNAAGVVTQAGQAAGAANASMIAAGGAGSAALGTVAAAAPWIGVGLMAYDWISGAADTAKQSREQITNLEKGIKSLQTKEAQFEKDIDLAGNKLSDSTQFAIKNANNSLEEFTTNVGNAVDTTGSNIRSTVKKSRGLTTGTEEVMKDSLTKNINEKVDTVSDKVFSDLDQILLSQAEGTREEIRGFGSTIEDIGFEIEGMEQNIDQLEKSDKWYENLI